MSKSDSLRIAEIVDGIGMPPSPKAQYAEGRLLLRQTDGGRMIVAGVVLQDLMIDPDPGDEHKHDELWLCHVKIVPLAKFRDPQIRGASVSGMLLDGGLEPAHYQQCLLWPDDLEKPEGYP